MEKEELRRLVFEVLKQDPQTHLNAVEFRVRSLAENYERHDALKIQEIIWELLIQGVLAPGKNSLNLNLPFLHVTDYGEECLQTGEIILHDPENYLRQFEANAQGPLDRIIRVYVDSAQKSFRCGNYLASMVLLAHAANRAIDLVDSLLTVRYRNTSPDKQHTWQEKLDRIQALLPSLDLADEMRDQISLHLQGLEHLMKHTQDSGGRTRAVGIERQIAQAALLAFPNYLKSIYCLIGKLESRHRQ